MISPYRFQRSGFLARSEINSAEIRLEQAMHHIREHHVEPIIGNGFITAQGIQGAFRLLKNATRPDDNVRVPSHVQMIAKVRTMRSGSMRYSTPPYAETTPVSK